MGDIPALLGRLDDDFTRALQSTDPHHAEYMARYVWLARTLSNFIHAGNDSLLLILNAMSIRLRDEALMYNAICATLQLVNKKGTSEERNVVTIRRIEHLYYKVNVLSCKLWRVTCTTSRFFDSLRLNLSRAFKSNLVTRKSLRTRSIALWRATARL
jgi:hypothetical protein